MIAVRDSPHGATFAVRVQPRASRTRLTGVLGSGEESVLKVALAAPPVDGRANETLVEFFADLLEVSRAAVQVLSGAQSRNKVLRVTGLPAEEIVAVLMAALPKSV